MDTSRSQAPAGPQSRRIAARRRILEAARALIEQRRWSEISLDEIMRAAELSRTIFYRHFGDRRALLDESKVALDPAGSIWKQTAGDPVPAVAEATERLARLFAEHGRLLQAVVDEAAADVEVRAIWLGIGEQLTQTTAARIEAEVAAGRSRVRDPLEVARALVWMNERYLLVAFGEQPLADPERTAAALTEIWTAVVYGAG